MNTDGGEVTPGATRSGRCAALRSTAEWPSARLRSRARPSAFDRRRLNWILIVLIILMNTDLLRIHTDASVFIRSGSVFISVHPWFNGYR